MTKLLDRLRLQVAPRDPEPLQSLLYAWAEARGRRNRLPFSQERLLESINEMPCLNRAQRTRSLGWSIRKFQSAQDQLEELGFVERDQISRGAGRPDSYLILTDQAFRYLRRLRIPERRLHGSLEHHCTICELKRTYRSLSYNVQVTATVDTGHIVDLLCTRDDEALAIEVVHSDNLKRDAAKAVELVRGGYDVLFVTTSADLFAHYGAKLSELLPAELRDKVHMAFRDELISALAGSEDGEAPG